VRTVNAQKRLGAERLIVVLGMHRSGTSAITRGLQALGVNLGDRFLPPQEDNRKGFWEDIDICALNVEMLTVIGSDWYHVAPIEAANVEELCKEGYLMRAVELLRSKVTSAPIFGFKDPRVAKLLPFWKEVFSHCQFDVSYIVALRHPLSVVKSLAKRDGIEAEQSYLLWLGHILTSLTGSAGRRRILVDYDRLLESPGHELNRIATCCDLEVDPAEMQGYISEFLDQGLRHTVYTLNDLLLDDTCPPIVREVYAGLLDVASEKTEFEDSELQNKIARWSDEFERLRSPLLLVDKLLAQKMGATQAVAERDAQIAALVSTRDRHRSSLAYRLRRRLAVLKWQRALAQSPLFNAEWYLQNYPDVASTSLDPLRHYLASGWREGRRPGPEFDGTYYVARYHDVAQLDIPPLVHYWVHGRFEGRHINAAFDVEWAPTGVDPLMGESRSKSSAAVEPERCP